MQQILIDGYNLMHALGFISPRTKAAGLEAARRRFLDYLAEHIRGRDIHLAVVFDAANAPRHVQAEAEYRGLTVYSAKHQEADDLIEELIRQQVTPKHLAVVSNDRRLWQAAERRGCVSLRSGEFLDWLDRPAEPRNAPHQATPGEKDTSSSSDEDWLREFGHLDDDPTLGKSLHFPEGGGQEDE